MGPVSSIFASFHPPLIKMEGHFQLFAKDNHNLLLTTSTLPQRLGDGAVSPPRPIPSETFLTHKTGRSFATFRSQRSRKRIHKFIYTEENTKTLLVSIQFLKITRHFA